MYSMKRKRNTITNVKHAESKKKKIKLSQKLEPICKK